MHDDDVAASDLRWMAHAVTLAEAAAARGEVPVGAVVLSPEGQLWGEGANSPVTDHDPTAHAEIVALRRAGAAAGNYRLTGATLIVTLEPCAMCAGAIAHSRIGRLVYGASDPKGGAIRHGPQLFTHRTIHHRLEITGGVEEARCGEMLKAFFRARREGGGGLAQG